MPSSMILHNDVPFIPWNVRGTNGRNGMERISFHPFHMSRGLEWNGMKTAVFSVRQFGLPHFAALPHTLPEVHRGD
jgi:hypothetical protein